MHTLNVILGYGFLALVVYIAVVFWLHWRKAVPQTTGDGTGFWNKNPTLQRIVMATQGSATILWNGFVCLMAAVVGGIGQFGDLIGDPNIRAYAGVILAPKVVAAAVLTIGIISIVARKRTL